MESAALLQHTAAGVRAYAAVLERAVSDPPLLDRPVAACPEWDLRGLTHHLGEVHRWATGAVREGHGRTEAPPGPHDAEPLLRWFDAGATSLLAALEGDPDAECWTFHPPRTLGFWQRRQAQEVLVHRWDAEAAVGESAPLDPDLAADGIAELLAVFVPRRLGKGWLDPLPAAITLRATDTGSAYVVGEGAPVAEVSAPAEVLLLRLWKRLPARHPALVWDGDQATGERLLAMPLSA